MTDEDALKYFYSLGEAYIPSGSEASFCSDGDGGYCEESQDCSGIYDVAETPQMRDLHNLVSDTNEAVSTTSPIAGTDQVAGKTE
ncbi:hypothetical protein PR048_032787 [Dryococelus australis]|uniref:Uncharacterized protein n=1 Tax=Dryococelus australis TaxID=614101 RepID=A0ABQ9G375_9NEOP|nr:hypothetical protein PR048_032787 [Dryococelus australis]